jgi:hypothetical protein
VFTANSQIIFHCHGTTSDEENRSAYRSSTALAAFSQLLLQIKATFIIPSALFTSYRQLPGTILPSSLTSISAISSVM